MRKNPALLVLIVGLICTLLCSCWGSKHPKEKAETKKILAYIQETDCLGDLTLWDTLANERTIEICFRGDCDLQKVFSTTDRANQYLETHPESILLENDIEFRIFFFPGGSEKRDWEKRQCFAFVEKAKHEKRLDSLEIHTEEEIKLSEFQNCQVSFDYVVATYNVVFDDPEALLSLQGLSAFQFSNQFAPIGKETLEKVLQSVCYYEDNGILPKFDFIFFFGGSSSNNEELRSTYKGFVESHPEYTVFHPLT